MLNALALTVSAQMTRKPTFRPDWTFKAPAPENSTYIYVVEHGEGNTKREALNQAIGRVFQSTANRIGQFVSTDEINRAVQAGTDYQVIARNMNVPVNKVCEFAVQDTTDYSWTMYILCQVAKTGNITPQFETSEECTKHQMYDQAMAKWNAQQAQKAKDAKKAEAKRNAAALVASVFVPGVGQMTKGHYVEGAITLVGEVALIGGGVGTLLGAQKQTKIMNSYGIDYATYQSAQKAKPIYQGVSYACFGLAAVLYGVNLWRAYTLTPKQRNYAFYPTIIPMEDTTNSNYALGLGATIKF